jgi:hypothetical protein
VPPKRIDKWHGQFIEYGTYLVPSRRERQKARKRRLTFRMPEATVAAIKAFVDDEPRAYLNEIRAWLFENRYYSPCSKSRKWSISTIYTTLRKRIGYTLTALRRLAMQADALEMLRFKRAIADVPAECIVFVDESHVDRRDVRRRRGWSPRGFSTDVREWFGRGDVAYTLLAAVNVDGFLLNATTAVTGSNDSARFADHAPVEPIRENRKLRSHDSHPELAASSRHDVAEMTPRRRAVRTWQQQTPSAYLKRRRRQLVGREGNPRRDSRRPLQLAQRVTEHIVFSRLPYTADVDIVLDARIADASTIQLPFVIRRP